MHSEIDWWDEERIMFYERASSFSSFHRELGKLIEKEISKSDKIIELGSGLGYLAQILDEKGYDITPYDISDNAIREGNKRIGKPLIRRGDAYAINTECSILLMIFFGKIRQKNDLDYFCSIPRKKLIYIISRHKANPFSQKKDERNDVITLLNKERMNYRLIDVSIPFDQPLRNEDEARRFFLLSYKNMEIPPLEKSDNENYPVIFRNNKEISIFIIEKEKI